MSKIKLREWAEKNNLSYLTANRHFHAGMIPGAVQLDSGTILVEDNSLEQNMGNTSSNDAMSLFLKKTVEYSKNNSSVEDFAAFVISNFQLRLNGAVDSPRYSKNKPKSEDIQNHFKQFLPDKQKEEQLKAIKIALIHGKAAGDIVPASDAPISTANLDNGSESDLLASLIDEPADPNFVHPYGNSTTGSLVTSVDFNTTPQQINYTGSNTNQAFSGLSPSASLSPAIVNNCTFSVDGATEAVRISSLINSGALSWSEGPAASGVYFNAEQAPFQPTQKELSATHVIEELSETEDTLLPKKRGRKPSKVSK
jgi:hypothetical protein